MKKLENWRKRSRDALHAAPASPSDTPNVTTANATQAETMTEAELRAALKLLMADAEDTVPAAFYRSPD